MQKTWSGLFVRSVFNFQWGEFLKKIFFPSLYPFWRSQQKANLDDEFHAFRDFPGRAIMKDILETETHHIKKNSFQYVHELWIGSRCISLFLRERGNLRGIEPVKSWKRRLLIQFSKTHHTKIKDVFYEQRRLLIKFSETHHTKIKDVFYKQTLESSFNHYN